jgi:hypothetical protein
MSGEVSEESGKNELTKNANPSVNLNPKSTEKETIHAPSIRTFHPHLKNA